MKYLIVFFFIKRIFFVLSSLQNWDLEAQSIDLLGSSSSIYYTIYEKNSSGINVTLKKQITKNSSGIINIKNYIYVDNESREVDFDDIGSQYTDKLGCRILICPKGKFHPYDFNNSRYLTINGFQEKGYWDLRCYYHLSEFFLIFYLLNDGKNFFYKFTGENEIKEFAQYYSYIYDFKLQNRDNNEDYDYKYKFPIIFNEGGNLKLKGDVLTFNYNERRIERDYSESKTLIVANNFVKATFDSNNKFYFITYKSASVFTSGYSISFVDFSDDNGYKNSTYYPEYVTKTVSPLTFEDNVEINEINFISGTQYAYYKINNTDKGITYYGLIDVVENRVLYNLNFNEDIISFKPVSSSEMLAITSISAYKICIIKSGDSCSDSCSSDNLILSINGNKCKSQSNCDSGKIKFIPDNICINKDSCNLNYYTLNSDQTECGLCNYFNPDGTKYKLINTLGCLSSIPNNTDYYNETLYLLKCKTNYHLDSDNECVPDYCYERCATCSEVSSDINNQKCKSCIISYGYILENGNCIIPQTTEIIPSTTEIIPSTTIIIPSTNAIIPPTTITDPQKTVNIPVTTIIEHQNIIITTPAITEIIPPTTVITPPTTMIIPPTTITPVLQTNVVTNAATSKMTEGKLLETCTNEKCLSCNEESDRVGLCLTCDENIYKKVNYTNKYSKYYNCFKEKDLEFKYYKDTLTDQYKPCFKLCKKCLGPGNATHHNCLECINNYMFRPGDNYYNNCVVASEYYYRSLYDEYRTLDIPFCPEEAKYIIKDEKNKTSCIFDCKADSTYNYLYGGYCLKQCPNNTKITNNSICMEDVNEIYISENDLHSNLNFTIKNIEIYAEVYATEFNYTDNHITSYKNDDIIILLYKNPNIISQANLKVPKIDFGECYEEIKKVYNISGNLITAIIDKKVKNNPSTFYLFFHPKTGKKLDANEICKSKNIKVEENLLSMLDEKRENYELQKALMDQGINIFVINDPYYKDICYDFDNPKNRDIALKDRIKETFVNITLCDDGCINTGIDVKNNMATCDCKFKEITNNDLINNNAALEYLVGELFDIVNSSNILVLKCYKYFLKYFTRSIGGIIIIILLMLCIIFTVIFFSLEFSKMKRYIFSLTEKYVSFLTNYSNTMKYFPPRKSLKNKTAKNLILKISKYDSKIENSDNDTNRRKSKKESTTRALNHGKSSNDYISRLNKRASQTLKLIPIKEKINTSHINDSTIYSEERKQIKKYFKDYLNTPLNNMEFDDAIKKDHRGFCRYFLENLEEKQRIAYTFIASDPINTRMIKFILFSLNIALYFVVNGLFFNEAFISELYHIKEKDENFFSFIPRTIDKAIYTTIVTSFIGYMTDFFFLSENKIKGIFKREKDNLIILKGSIVIIIYEIQKRYISFIIMTFVILLISLYYILCFNYVYPKTQIEWIKSSILIIFIMQILSILKCLYEAIFRFLSFICQSEKLYKISKLF